MSGSSLLPLMAARLSQGRVQAYGVLALGCIAGGSPGALFDQLTVTLSPDYFLLGKGLSSDSPPCQRYMAWPSIRPACWGCRDWGRAASQSRFNRVRLVSLDALRRNMRGAGLRCRTDSDGAARSLPRAHHDDHGPCCDSLSNLSGTAHRRVRWRRPGGGRCLARDSLVSSWTQGAGQLAAATGAHAARGSCHRFRVHCERWRPCWARS